MYGPILAVFHGGGGVIHIGAPKSHVQISFWGGGSHDGVGGGPVTTRAKGWRRSSRAVLL